MRCVWQAAVVIWGFLMTAGSGAPLQAGEYKDPGGFSFQYPEGWWPATELTRDDVPEEIRKWLEKNSNFDFSKIRVLVVDVKEEGFSPNCNVVVNPFEIPVTEKSLQQMLKMVPDQLQSIGVVVRNIQGTIVQIGPNKAIRLKYDSEMPGLPDPLHQLQLLIPGGGKSHVVTCTSLLSEAARDAPAFQSILESFRVPPVQGRSIDWGNVGSSSLTGGIVGGITAGLVAGLMQFFKKKKADPAKAPASDG